VDDEDPPPFWLSPWPFQEPVYPGLPDWPPPDYDETA
jgi:hypothetical protein